MKNSGLSLPITAHFTSTPSSRKIVIMRGIISATPPPRAVELTIQTVRPSRCGTRARASVRSERTASDRWMWAW